MTASPHADFRDRPGLMPPPLIQQHGQFLVVRDDMLPGGSKSRVLFDLMNDNPAQEFVYAGTPYGCTHLALAYAARALGKTATIFIPQRHRSNWTHSMLEAETLGARFIDVPSGTRARLHKQAETYCAARPDVCLLPRGLDTDAFPRAFIACAAQIPLTPQEVWCASSSGTLTRALQAAWPYAEHHAVIVRKGAGDTGSAIQHAVSTAFECAAKLLPPFPSAPHFDAKAWGVMQKLARPGALFWNVAG